MYLIFKSGHFLRVINQLLMKKLEVGFSSVGFVDVFFYEV